MEYYHLPWVHPELNTVSSLDNHERFQGPGLYTGMCTTPLARNPGLPIDLGALPAMPGLTAKDAETAYWILIVPNLALFLLPHHLFTLLYRPDGVGHTIEYADMLVHPDVLALARAAAKCAAIFALLGHGQRPGHRGRRAGAEGAGRHGLPGRPDVLPLRGVDPPVPEHHHRPDDRQPADPAGRSRTSATRAAREGGGPAR